MDNQNNSSEGIVDLLNLKKGQRVIMHTCLEARNYKGKEWVVRHDSFTLPDTNDEVVYLVDYVGWFRCKYLNVSKNLFS